MTNFDIDSYMNQLTLDVNPYPITIFFLFMSAAFIQVYFRLDLFMEANNMNPNQTAQSEQSDLGPYCLQYIKLQTRRADDKSGS